ncbi:MAG TPA: hypothetical protein VNJ70_14840 [Thermoanaerobaculia bacterium]|nr:hypothetical protein [Thermoanaerobaculia bacterium]
MHRTFRLSHHSPRLFVAALLLVTGAAVAVEPPNGGSPLASRAYRDPNLYISSVYKPVAGLSSPLAGGLAADLSALGVATDRGFVDVRSGSWGTLILRQPLIPGAGAGNNLSWAQIGLREPDGSAALKDAAWTAFNAWLTANQPALGVVPAELGKRTVTAHGGGQLVQINVRRQFGGVPVRDSFLSAVVNGGNLVLFGVRNWGAVGVAPQPTVSGQAAIAAAEAHAGRGISGYWSAPRLEIVPLSAGRDALALGVGEGLSHRLVWAIGATFSGDHGSWEALVDAHSGEVLAFQDTNQYLKSVQGGAFPVSNDGVGIEGQEQAGQPMPFADIRDAANNLFFTDSGGDLVCAAESSSIRTALAGRYVRINDTCGAINETAASGDLDLGQGPGTDCAVPPGHSPGDTHASRTGFYEVNRIIEQAKGWLPENEWLHDQLRANMNINNTCNAFWSGGSGTINFYRSGGGCRNTGEIAAIFDHEWGHGMDNNDANPSISAPGEAYADVAAILRLNTSCIGRGFRSTKCGGNGDPCTECTGVREVDWQKRASGTPHNLDWNQQDPLDPNGVRGGCRINGVGSTSTGPCNNGTHCEGSMASEVIWDLLKRDLPCNGSGWDIATGQCAGGAAPSIDDDTALELMTRYYYVAGGALGNWYNCNPVGPAGSYGDGCNADGAYLNFLAVDDDNGDLTDGTPHMEAIFAAFDRHQIACPTPAPADAGCAAAPAAPSVSIAPVHKGAVLSWNPVPGASEYWVYRTEGIMGCDFGKTRVGETTGTSFTDGGLHNGREYRYGVVAVGASDACTSPMSACTPVTAGGNGASMVFTDSLARLTGSSGGDGDDFVDNCETWTVAFDVNNNGEVPLTNVRVAHVENLSHPEIQIVDTPTFSPSLASCSAAQGTFRFTAAGLEADDTILFRIDVTADEIAPNVISKTAKFVAAESDFVPVASRTWSFDSDREDWTVTSGTFDHSPDLDAKLGSGFLQSSKFQDDQCDVVQSPTIRLTGSSTLSLYNRFLTEAGEPNVLGFYDRANVGVRNKLTGDRTTVVPDGGRLYNASGPHGACVTAEQEGWAGAGPGFLESTWTAGALNPSGGFTGDVVALEVGYGTDPIQALDGLQFDEVTLTNFQAQGPDGWNDVCRACTQLDDGDAAVEYRGGWFTGLAAGASGGGYHYRTGASTAKGKPKPAAAVTFTGDTITYFFAKGKKGGTANVYLDGALRETLSYAGTSKDPTFGFSVTYSGLGAGTHELTIEHASGTVWVDGFEFCGGGGANADAVEFRSEARSSQHALAPIVTQTVTVGPNDEQVSVLVEGLAQPLTVRLLDPLGLVVATGQALVAGEPESGLDAAVARAGTYTVQVLNPLGLAGTVNVGIARTVRVP